MSINIDYLECVQRLRPGIAWKNNTVNPASLATIAKTYLNDEPIPTLAECEGIWPEIEAEHVAGKQRMKDIRAEKASLFPSGITAKQAKDAIKAKFVEIKKLTADDKLNALADAIEELETKQTLSLLR